MQREDGIATKRRYFAAANGILLRGARLLDLGSGVIKHGSVSELQHRLHLDAEGIANAAKEILHEKDPA